MNSSDVDRIACRKATWGARISQHWLQLMLVVLALVAVGLAIHGLF